jgi:glycosyltransferase involved in cell wall biosynthesis
VQSQAFIEPIRQLGIAKEKLVFLPNSAESFYRPLDPEMVAAPTPLPPGLRILFAGNVGAAQGFDTIIDAAALLVTETDIHWLVVGEGRELAQVKAEVARRRLTERIRFFGRYPAETMPAWFAHAHVLLVSLRPAPAFSFTIPSKLQSYMACGRPILAVLDGEGARIVAEAGAGLTVPAGDAQALADAVLLMRGLSDGERENMGRRGREYYDVNFDRNLIMDRLENLMKQVVRSRTTDAQ